MYDQCNNSYADKTVLSWKENTHVKLIGSLFLIHYIKHLWKWGIIKILVYSSVIDINQMEGIFATIVTGGWGRFV